MFKNNIFNTDRHKTTVIKELIFDDHNLPQRENNVPTWLAEPEIEILMPVYNQDKYIEKALDSVLSQNYYSLKVRILDDGSINPLEKRLKNFINTEKVELISQSNSGLPLSLKKLHSLSYSNIPPAEFITWHSSDNNYLENALRTLSRFLVANPDLSLCYGNVKLINDEGFEAKNSNYRKEDQIYLDNSTLDLSYPISQLSYFNDNFINACFIYRNEFDRLIPPYKAEDLGYEDYKHWLMLTLFADAAHIGEKEALYEYRLHENALSSKISQNDLRNKQLYSVKKAHLSRNLLKGAYGGELLEYENKFHINLRKSKTILDDDSLLLVNFLKNSFLNFSLCPEDYQPIHESHINYLNSPQIILDSDEPYLKTLTPSFSIPNILFRARNRDFAAYKKENSENAVLGIFSPADSESHEESISTFIASNPNVGFILIAQSEKERLSADKIYLMTKNCSNLRIIDTRLHDNSNFNLSNPSLLYALGSIDALVSLLSFENKALLSKRSFDLGLHPVCDSMDFIAEACFASAIKRPLLAPTHFKFKCRNPTKSLPNVFPWTSSIQIPANIVELKNDISELSCNAILRLFSKSSKERQILSLILNDFIN